MDKEGGSYKAGRDAFKLGHLYSDIPSLLNLTINMEAWKAGYIDALTEAVRDQEKS